MQMGGLVAVAAAVVVAAEQTRCKDRKVVTEYVAVIEREEYKLHFEAFAGLVAGHAVAARRAELEWCTLVTSAVASLLPLGMDLGKALIAAAVAVGLIYDVVQVAGRMKRPLGYRRRKLLVLGGRYQLEQAQGQLLLGDQMLCLLVVLGRLVVEWVQSRGRQCWHSLVWLGKIADHLALAETVDSSRTVEGHS
jgi:hypothetical protein